MRTLNPDNITMIQVIDSFPRWGWSYKPAYKTWLFGSKPERFIFYDEDIYTREEVLIKGRLIIDNMVCDKPLVRVRFVDDNYFEIECETLKEANALCAEYSTYIKNPITIE